MVKFLKDLWEDAANKKEAEARGDGSNMESEKSKSRLSNAQSNVLLASGAAVDPVYFEGHFKRVQRDFWASQRSSKCSLSDNLGNYCV